MCKFTFIILMQIIFICLKKNAEYSWVPVQLGSWVQQ